MMKRLSDTLNTMHSMEKVDQAVDLGCSHVSYQMESGDLGTVLGLLYIRN